MKGRAVVDSTETSSLALCNNKCTWSSFEVADDHRDRAARRLRAHYSTDHPNVPLPRHVDQLGVVFWDCLPEGPVRAEFRTGTGGPEARARMLRAGVTPSVACKVVTVLAAMEADLLNPLDVNSLSAAYLAARPSKGIS